jgi:tetratricopeptide (TPR) repeat protein
METQSKNTVLVGVGALVVIGVGLLFFSKHADAPVAPPIEELSTISTSSPALSTPPPTQAMSIPKKRPTVEETTFPLNPSDTTIVWSNGIYTGNETLMQNARVSTEKLLLLLGKGEYDDYDIYEGIANNYASIGEGKTAYTYYNRAIRIHPQKGLGYVNLGHLMEQIHAYHTASDAFAKAVSVEPGVLEYHAQRIRFLTEQFPKENTLIFSALDDASKQFGDNSALLSIQAEWLTGQKKYTEAIAVWKTIRNLSSSDRQTAIDTEIARLQAKQ